MKWSWAIIKELINQLNEEVDSNGGKLYLVNIPYVPQLYEEVWDISFGLDESKYDRFIGNRRIKAICEELKVKFIDTTFSLKNRSNELKEWVHYPFDAHPTPEGHKVIAQSIFDKLIGLNNQDKIN